MKRDRAQGVSAVLPRPSREAFHFPAFAIRAADELVRSSVLELQPGRVPFERGLGEARRYAAEQHGFGQRAGVIEVRAGPALAADGVEELMPVAYEFELRQLVARKLFLRQQHRLSDMWQHHHATRADEDRTLRGKFGRAEQRLHFLRRALVAVIDRKSV